MNKIIFYLAFGIIWFAGCSNNSENDAPLARVDDEKLTYKELASRFDTTSMKSKKKLQDYLNHWINTTTLYKEAENSDITDSDEYEELLKEAKKEIAVNLLLKREVYDKKITVDDSEVLSYYYQHRNEFFLGSDVINISHATFVNESSALEFRNNVLSDGKDWKNALNEYIKSHAQDLVVSHEDSAFFKQQSELYPPDIWKSVVPLGINELSRPLRVFDGFMIVKLNSFQKAGDIGNLEFAKSEIFERIIVEKKRQLYLNYLKSLRDKYKTENYYE